MTKIFFDMEFTGLHQETTIISIGLISDDGKTFYAELNDYDETQVDDWISDNVISNLTLTKQKDVVEYSGDDKLDNVRVYGNKKQLKKYLTEWLSQFEQVEMWGNNISYKWVLFNSIFMGGDGIPHTVYKNPFDISTKLHIDGYNSVLKENRVFKINDNLNDVYLSKVIIIKKCYEKLNLIDNDKRYYVYGYLDLNGEFFYIGKGTGNRFLSHLNYKINTKKDGSYINPHKSNKINKILESISVEEFISNNIILIYSGLNEKQALLKESELILKYGRIDLNNGILTNLTSGGEFCIGNHYKTREHCEKISKTLTGKNRTIASRTKQSKSVTAEKNHMYGKKRSEQVKLAISKAKSKPIIMDGVYYNSTSEAAKINNISRTTIYRILKKQNEK